MMISKAHIPNSITLLNLFCGCIALVFVAEKQFEMGFLFVAFGIFFDFFDGFFARKFNVSGPLGVQLDSLADMVTSGVVPGFVMYQMLQQNAIFHCQYVPYLGFIITLGACYRLANFNIDTRQSDSFIGLPTPANTLFILSLPLLHLGVELPEWFVFATNFWVLLGLTFLSAIVMNAEIPLFSLKIKNFSFQKYALQLVFLVIAVLLLLFLKFLGLALVILLYVVLSIVSNLSKK